MPSFADCRGVLLDSYKTSNHLDCPSANVVKTEFGFFIASLREQLKFSYGYL